MTRGLARVPRHIRQDVAQRTAALREARSGLGYSLSVGARLARIGVVTLADMEVGRTDPLLDRYLRAALTFARPLDERLQTHDIVTVGELEVLRWRQALRQARQNAGMSQQEVADKTEMVQSAIARIELGVPVPRLTTMLRIAEVVGADV